VTKLRVTCVGGGSGGAGNESYNLGASGTYSYARGTAGGTTSFGSVQAAGGGNISITVDITRSHNFANENQSPRYAYRVNSFYYSAPGGSAGFSQYQGDSASWTVLTGSSMSIENYTGGVVGWAGKGGNGHTWQTGQANLSSHGPRIGGTGGTGYKNAQYITVTAGSVISYSVGGGGPVTGNNPGYYGATAGGNGAIYIEWGQGIQ
jgi:hypothetical protein